MPAARRRAAQQPADTLPDWSGVLRAVREAYGVTQDGWAAWLGVGRRTVQRWERGEVVPDPAIEAAILAYCREKGLFRNFHNGPLQGVTLTPEWLRRLVADARLGIAAGAADPPTAPVALPKL